MTINVGEIVKDPDFCLPMQVTRGVMTINENGVAERANSFYDIMGVLDAHDSFELERLAEGEQLRGDVKIYTTFALTAGSESTTADVIRVDGAEYTVVSVENWQSYGYTAASCKLVSTRADVDGGI